MEATEESRRGNPLGTASAIVSSLGLMICLVAVTWGYALHAERVAASEKIAAGEYAEGEPTGVMVVGFSFLGQIVVYVVGVHGERLNGQRWAWTVKRPLPSLGLWGVPPDADLAGITPCPTPVPNP